MLARANAAELQAMTQMLNLRAAEIAMEMQTLQDLDKDGLGELPSPVVARGVAFVQAISMSFWHVVNASKWVLA